MADASAEAAAKIQELEERHAEDPQGRYLVALANEYRKAGEIDHAEQLLQERLRQTPGYLSAHIVLGRCFADRGALDAAGEEFLYVLSIDPQNLIALRSLGEIAFGAGRHDEAQRWYRELLAVDPMNEDARLALAQMGADAEAEFESVSGWWRPKEEEVENVEEAMPPDDTPEELSSAETLASTALPVAEDAFAPAAAESLADGDVKTPSDGEEEHAAPTAVSLDEEIGDADELVSQTIGDLYAQQGFHQRAAQVYETLLRTRGEDPTLRSKLSDLRAWMAGEMDAESLGSETAASTGPSDREDLGSGEAETEDWDHELFAASFAHGFDEDEEAVGATGTDGEEAEKNHGPFATRTDITISAYLSRLLSWRPSPQLPLGAEENLFPWEGGVGIPSQVDLEKSADVLEYETSEPGVPDHPGEGAESTGGAPPLVDDSVETDDDLESFQAWLRSLKP